MATADSTTKPCCVYVIQAASGAVKIGIAGNVNTRLNDLQTANPEKLKLLYKLEVRNRRAAEGLESLLHERYAEDNIRGEWFSTNLERLFEDLRFAMAFTNHVRMSVEVYEPPVRKRRVAQPKSSSWEQPSTVRLYAVQLDSIAKWAIERGRISVGALVQFYGFEHAYAQAILNVYHKHGCLVPVEGIDDEFIYDANWKNREAVHS